MDWEGWNRGDVRVNVYLGEGSDGEMGGVNVEKGVWKGEGLVAGEVRKMGVEREKEEKWVLKVVGV